MLVPPPLSGARSAGVAHRRTREGGTPAQPRRGKRSITRERVASSGSWVRQTCRRERALPAAKTPDSQATPSRACGAALQSRVISRMAVTNDPLRVILINPSWESLDKLMRAESSNA